MPPSRRDDRRALGAEGEARAAAFLAGHGYRILDRNVRAGGVEIDLVAARGSLLVFVEVKTRRSARFGAPGDSVDAAKRARLVRAAAAWLQAHRGSRRRRVRFDVITCRPAGPGGSRVGEGGAWQIEHLEGAFDASG